MFLAVHLVQVVIAVWLAVAVDVRSGLSALGAALSRSVAFDLVVLFVGAALLWVAAGRRRSLGRDFDLACVAFIPYIVVKLVANLGLELAGVAVDPTIEWIVRTVAIGWAGAVLVAAWQQTRQRGEGAS